jgi:hypothetical protein
LPKGGPTAFFNISLSMRSCRFSASNWRIRCRSALSGLPIPACPACSAVTCFNQRLTAVSPIFISSQTADA